MTENCFLKETAGNRYRENTALTTWRGIQKEWGRGAAFATFAAQLMSLLVIRNLWCVKNKLKQSAAGGMAENARRLAAEEQPASRRQVQQAYVAPASIYLQPYWPRYLPTTSTSHLLSLFSPLLNKTSVGDLDFP